MSKYRAQFQLGASALLWMRFLRKNSQKKPIMNMRVRDILHVLQQYQLRSFPSTKCLPDTWCTAVVPLIVWNCTMKSNWSRLLQGRSYFSVMSQSIWMTFRGFSCCTTLGEIWDFGVWVVEQLSVCVCVPSEWLFLCCPTRLPKGGLNTSWFPAVQCHAVT